MTDIQMMEVPVSEELKYDGAVIRVEKWQVRLPDGRLANRDVVKHLGAAAIVPVDENGMTTLVRQHRVVAGEMTWEIPAGKLDKAGEDKLLCAQRELSEETGLTAKHWTHLSTVLTTPGFCTERIGLFLATGLTAGKAHTDEDEFLSIKTLSLKDAKDQVMAGELIDVKTALAIMMAWDVLKDPARRQALGVRFAEDIAP